MDESSRTFEIDGRQLGYPTEFRDGRSAQGLFLVDAGVASGLIAESGFRVAEVAPGRGVLSLNCVDYLDTDCGTYLETALAFFVDKPGTATSRGPGRYLRTVQDVVRGDIASFTWTLQVTTVLSEQAGIQMWGFPKTIEDISLDTTGGNAAFSLRMDGRQVFRYSVRMGGARTPPPLASPVYSIFEGAPHLGVLTQRYSDCGYRVRGGTLELGDHPMADRLRELKVGARPLLAVWAGHLAFSMSAPRRLETASRSSMSTGAAR